MSEKNIEEKKNQKKIVAISISLIVLLVALAGIIHFVFTPKAEVGTKNIDIVIVFEDKTEKTIDITTDEEFLRGALEQENLISGSESEYGLFITAVDGIEADSSQQAWWCITKGGEQVNTGVDSTPIFDGDTYEITYTIGY